MNDLPLRYLACMYAAGGLIALHGLLHLFGFGHRAGLGRNPHRGPNMIYDAIAASYVAVLGLLAFGSVGLLATLRGDREPAAIISATGAAIVVLFAGVTLQRLLRRIAAQANAGHIHTLVGLSGVVTAAIPGEQKGRGTVRLVVRMRPVEYPALTAGAELPVGAAIRVAAVAGPGTLAVMPDLDFKEIWKTFTSGSEQPEPEGER